MTLHGKPFWYERSSQDPAGASAFYGPLLGWRFQDAGMSGFSYTLALAAGDMVAGMMQPDAPMPDAWLIYFAVEHCDGAAERAKGLGATVLREAADIPGTGRFAILADPQGAVFGILQPEGGEDGHAFDQAKSGHGNWHELQSSDPVAALAFYTQLLGWSAGRAMDMGPMGNYQIFAHDGRDIGGMMPLQAPGTDAHWLPYFGVPSANDAKTQIETLGGRIAHGPAEVPGGAFIVMAQDPHDAWFAVVGPA